jgi:putative transposase
MTTEQKVDLVAGVQETYGLAPVFEAVELPRSTWYYHQKEKVSYQAKYTHLHPLLEKIARQHPEYGYRRTTQELARLIKKPSTTRSFSSYTASGN